MEKEIYKIEPGLPPKIVRDTKKEIFLEIQEKFQSLEDRIKYLEKLIESIVLIGINNV